MKKILGLDLGTNSIGWALIDNEQKKILGMGSRIIPMDEGEIGKFAEGVKISKTADRTNFRGIRRLRERNLLRRERLHRVLNVLGFLPEHYTKEIDFEKRFGQFLEETEPKLAWKKNGKKDNGKDKFEFLFQDLFIEMIEDFKKSQPQLFYIKKNGEETKIPYDWTIYYLRKKALEKAISKEQLAWLILNFNQKRGYYQLRGEDQEENPNKLVEFHSLKVVDVKPEIKYNLILENGETYYRTSETSLLNWKDSYQDFIVTKYADNTGKEKQSFFLKIDASVLKSRKPKSSKKKAKEIEGEQSIKIVDVIEEKQDKIWYSLVLENGWIYRRESNVDLSDWKDKIREFIVTTDLNDDRTVKIDTDGKESRSFRAPKEDDWTLIKKKTENDIDKYIKEHKTNNDLAGTVGTYIYDTLLKNPKQKIIGKLVRTIERKFYKVELRQILQKQIELQPELFTNELYNDCVRELYRNNEAHQLSLGKRDFIHLFLDDIIFYQRPLKSQKSSIGNCALEYQLHKINKKDEQGNTIKNVFEQDENGKDIEVKEYLKAIPKSNPYYQEFRIWQWLFNLKIYQKDDDKDVTDDFIKNTSDKENLFSFLMTKKEVNHKDILHYLIVPKVKEKFPDTKPKALKEETAKEINKHRWNYVYNSEKDESKLYPMNETGSQIRTRLEKVTNLPDNFLTKKIEQELWHIIYSVNDKNEFEKALESFAKKKELYYIPKESRDLENPDKGCFGYNFKNLVWKEKSYGSFSEKAIKKLLPLMRIGKYWNFDAIDGNTKQRIQNLQNAEVDESIKNRVREQAHKEKLDKNEDFQGLQLWLAQYIVYDRHSEAEISGKWKSIADLEKYLDEFKQHSLRNPIVEQVMTETLCVVKDIWQHYGKGAEDFFDEIHIELGREMKNTAEDRKQMTNQITENENTNLRIKTLLMEFANDEYFKNQEDYKDEKGDTPAFYKKGNNPVKAFSPTQQEILKIYEDGVLNSGIEIPNEVSEIIKKFKESDAKKQPTKTEVDKYKLWLEQKYKSPYTGQIIPLSKLFTPDYQIEHIIPKSRYFDDSLSNKVICEAAVNSLKDKQLGLEFIKNHHGEKVTLGDGTKNTVEILSEDRYKTFVKEHYDKNRSKRNKLLLEEIPDKMIERQLNDTRYISKFISNVLSNIVRTDKDDDGVNSKNILPGNGKITSTLRQEWGLNDVWNTLILPRFERMNHLTNTTNFTTKNKEGHTIPAIPLELSKGFQKKRIDHRHHALDALVIACATRDHIQYLNNENAKSQKHHLQMGLAKKLRKMETVKVKKWRRNDNNVWEKTDEKITKTVPKDYLKPWDSFTVDAKSELEKIVVSFKQNLRVINKTKFTGLTYKESKEKSKDRNWAVRQPLHEETVSGLVKLSWVQVDKEKGEITTATRKALDKNFNLSKIEKITDTGIQKILTNYLTQDKFKIVNSKGEVSYNTEFAFSPEGIEEMNKNISQFNNGKFHQPIFKVRIYEKGTGRFQLGIKGNKKNKYVQGAPNLFFGIYLDKEGNRNFETIPLDKVIERLKQRISSVPENKTIEKKKEIHELRLQFHLSPDDLVYVPTEDERENINAIDFNNLTKEQKERIFFVNDFSGSTCYFRPNRIAKAIVAKEVDMNYDEKKKKTTGSFDTKTASFEGKQIKDICIKLNVGRLGNIIPFSNIKFYPNPSHQPDEAKEGVSYFKTAKISTLQQSEERMLLHTSNMNPEERMAYLQQLRETTQNSNLSEDEKISILSKFKINPTDENS